MKIYKWDSLTLKACQCLSSSFHIDKQGIYGILLALEQRNTGQIIKPWRENALEIREKAWKIIENWDIRIATKLFEIFPSIIAKKYHSRSFTAGYDEKGDWIIVFD